MAGSDIVFSCVATPSDYVLGRAMPHIIDAWAAGCCRRLATISSVGVGDSAELWRRTAGWFMSRIERWLFGGTFKDHQAAEDALMASDLDWVVVRPVQLGDAPGTGLWEIVDVSDVAKGPIMRENVAAFLVSLVEDRSRDRSAVTIGRPFASPR